MKSRFTISVILYFLVLTCHAQNSQDELPVFKRVTNAFMPSITSEYFFFSNDGLIWFSTAKGLASFDGSELLYHCNLKQSTLYGLTRIGAMLEDQQHNFYLTTPMGLFYYNRRNETFSKLEYQLKNSTDKSAILFTTLFKDTKGQIYIGSIFSGLFIYDPEKKHFEHINLDNSTTDIKGDRMLNTIFCFATVTSDPDQLWVGTFHGIYSFNKEKKQFSQHFEIVTGPENIYSSIFKESRQNIDVQRMDVENDSTIWFNSWTTGFANYNTRTGKAKIVFGWKNKFQTGGAFDAYIIPKFVKQSTGKYLLGIFNGKTAFYDTKTNTASFFNVSEKNYDHEQTRYTDKDRDGNIWILQRGILYVSLPPTLRLQHIESIVNKSQQPELRGIYFDTTKKLIYGAYLFSTGINVYDSNFHLKNILTTLPIKNYYNNGSGIDNNITKDGSGRYWTAGWIVQVLLPGEKKFEAAYKLFPQLKWLANSGEFDDAVTTRDGNILLKKNKGLVYIINEKTFATDTLRFTGSKENGVTLYTMHTFYDPRRNDVNLVGKNGIEQYNLTSKKMRSIANSTLLGNTDSMEATIYPELDASGRIWSYIPQYGFRIINPETLLCIDSIQFEEKGLMKRTYDQIKSGPENYMYLHAQNGVVIYNYTTQNSFLFDNTNGLSSPEDISLLSANGNMIIGQRGGFDFFKTANLDQYTSNVKPWLNTVIADSIIFARLGAENNAQVQLTYLQNTITFSFSALEYFFPERIEYEYQLWPVDLKFSKTDFFNRKITYSKLQPGKYIFKLKAQMEGGNWEDAAVEFPFEIVPAFWQTTWFKLLCFLLVGSILFLFFRWRIHSIRNKQNLQLFHEKELLDLEAKALRAQMNPHFIFNSLNSIKSLINKNDNDTAANYLAVFSKLIRTLFQNSDKREVSLYEEIETCKLYTQIEKMRFGNKVGFQFNVDEHIDLKDIRVPALILQPFIENAIWHGMVHKEFGGRVQISIEEINGGINCIIDDNGIGRDISKQFKSSYETTYESKGIGLTKARLHLDKLLNDREDKITIIDKKDAAGRPEGTKVIITFKQN